MAALITAWWRAFKEGLFWFIAEQKPCPQARLENNLLFWGQEGIALDALSTHPLPARQIDLLLVPTEVLSHNLVLPKAVKQNLSEVIKLEIERLTPFRSDDVYFDYFLCEESTQNIEVFLVLCPKKKLDPWLGALGNRGVQVQKIGLKEHPAINLLRQSTPLPKAKVMILGTMFAAVLLFPTGWGMTKLFFLTEEKGRIEKRWVTMAKIQQNWQLKRTLIQYPSEQKHKAPSITMVWAELLRLLPSDVHLSAMELAGSEMTFWAFGNSPKATVDALSTSSYLREVHATGVAARDNGQVQFMVNAKLQSTP